MKRNYQNVLTGIIIVEIIISSAVILAFLPYLNNISDKNKTIDFSNEDNPLTSVVYSPWSRDVIWSDIGETYQGAFIPTDIENDGLPEIVVPTSTNKIYIVNYSGGSYNKQEIIISELSGKTSYGVEVIDFNKDGIKEIYFFTFQDMGSYWQSQIWEGTKINYNTWNWNEVFTWNDTNIIFGSRHKAMDLDNDGDLEILAGTNIQESVTANCFLISFEYNHTDSRLYNTTIDSVSLTNPAGIGYWHGIGDIDDDGYNEVYSVIKEDAYLKFLI